MEKLWQNLNFIRDCSSLRLSWWQCPPVLFIIFGIITIISLVTTSQIASRYFDDPETMTVLSVTLEAVVFMILGHIIIGGFNRIAEAKRMQAEFISIISHQLRSPLTAFQWTEDIIEREFKKTDPDPEVIRKFMLTLRETTGKMVRLVATLLDVSRVDSRTLVLHKQPLSLEKLTKEIIKEFSYYANASNINISFEPDGVTPEISADPERTTMVIRNFIDNAIRYTNNSGNIRIAVEGYGNTHIRWKIRDQGIGIISDDRTRVFEKFFRGENALMHQAVGSGIGLYIARAIVEASGGEVGFSSTPEKGSDFWFTLPIK